MGTDPLSVWRLATGTDDFASLLPADENDYDRLEPLDGTPMAPGWRPFPARWSTDGGRLPVPDVASLEAPALTPRAVDALADLLEGQAELLPLDVAGGPAASLVNVMRLSAALDEQASEVKRFPDGRLMRAVTHVFDPEALRGHTIFKLRQAPRTWVYVTDAVVDRIRVAGLTGADLRHVWSA